MKTSFQPQLNYNPALIAQAAGGILSTGIGLLQRASANKWLKNNQQPIEAMPNEIKQNQQLAQIRANTGLPSEQYNNAMKNIQRQQLMTLRSAQMMGGGRALGILGGINEQGNNAVGDLDAADAQARLTNEGQLMNVNNNVASWKSNLFDKNIRQKWMREWQQKMGELGSGNQNLTSGIDSLAAAGIGFAGEGGFGSGRNSGGYTGSGAATSTGRTSPMITGNSPAQQFGTIPYNPNRPVNPQGLYQFLNRPR